MPEARFRVILQFKHPRYQSKEGTADLQGLLYMVSLFMMEVEVLTEHRYEIEELGSFIMLSREATDWVNTIQAVAVLVYGSAKNEVSGSFESPCNNWTQASRQIIRCIGNCGQKIGHTWLYLESELLLGSNSL